MRSRTVRNRFLKCSVDMGLGLSGPLSVIVACEIHEVDVQGCMHDLEAQVRLALFSVKDTKSFLSYDHTGHSDTLGALTATDVNLTLVSGDRFLARPCPCLSFFGTTPLCVNQTLCVNSYACHFRKSLSLLVRTPLTSGRTRSSTWD